MVERRLLPQPKHAPPRGVFFALHRLFCLAGVLLFVLSWLLPNHYVPWIAFHNEAAAFGSVAMLLFAWLSRGRIHHVGKTWLAPLLLLPLIAIHLLAGKVTYFGDTWISALYIAGFSASFWLGRQHAADHHSNMAGIRAFATAMVTAAVISSWLAWHQWLGLERLVGFNAIQDLIPGGRPFGNLGQPNHFATLLMMALPMAVVLFMQRVMNTWQFACVVAVLTSGLAIAGSRASIVGAVLWVGLFPFFARKFWGRQGFAMLLAWLVTFVLSVAAINLLNRHLLLAAGGRAFEGMVYDSPRITLWSQYWVSILESPWIGYGWRQSIAAQKIGAMHHPADLPTDYAHNILLDLMAWVGLPLALAIVVVALVYLFVQLRRICTPVQCLCIASAIPFLFQCLVEFPFAYAYFLFSFAWLMGHTSEPAIVEAEGASTVDVGHAPSRFAYVATSVFAICLLMTWLEYLQAEEEYRVMRFEIRKIGKIPIDHQRPHLVLLTQLDALLTYGRWEPSYHISEVDLEGLRVANRSIHWATLQTKLIVALAINGQTDEAMQELDRLEAVFGTPTRRQSELVLMTYQTRFPELRQLLVNTR